VDVARAAQALAPRVAPSLLKNHFLYAKVKNSLYSSIFLTAGDGFLGEANRITLTRTSRKFQNTNWYLRF